MRHVFTVTVTLAALVLCGACTVTSDPADPRVADTPPLTGDDLLPRGGGPSRSGIAVIDFSYLDLNDPEVAANVARADIVVLETATLWAPNGNAGGIAALKSINPDVKVLGYINAHASWLRWGDPGLTDPENHPYASDWYSATRPYWSYTTTGDTMMSWPGKVLLDVLDPACRAAMIGVIAEHWNAHDNVLDGVLWDHYNFWLWTPTQVAGVEGQMDLDRDGIPHREDEDEMAAYRAASEAMIEGLRAALGPQVIQVANGGRAAGDSSFAGLLDGMMYENFADMDFGGQSLRLALDPANPCNLFAAQQWPRSGNGGPWLIYANKFVTQFSDDQGLLVRWRLAEYARVVALLTGGRASFHGYDQKYRYDWPSVDVDLGDPAGPAVIDGGTIVRDFADGRVTLTFTGGELPQPFDFVIEQGGRVVQSLEYPRHFP